VCTEAGPVLRAVAADLLWRALRIAEARPHRAHGDRKRCSISVLGVKIDDNCDVKQVDG
jgi:hypothetical protein